MMLSSIITIIVETFLPESHQKYLFMNYKQSSQYRQYKSFVPVYLHDRPRSTISHCLERRLKSLKYTSDDIQLDDDENGLFTLKGTSGKSHKIAFATPSCTCRDWTTWHLPCKHFFGIFRIHPKWNWNSLPESYRNSPYLSTDDRAIADHFQPDVEDQVSRDPDALTCTSTATSDSNLPEKKVCSGTIIIIVSSIPLLHATCTQHCTDSNSVFKARR